MKYFAVVFVIASLAVLCQGKELTEEEQKKSFHAAIKKCQDTEKATDADYEETIKHEVPSTDAGKCLRACLFETFGVLKDNKFDLDVLTTLQAKKHLDEALKTALKEISAECAPLAVDADRCVIAGKFIQCYQDKLVARGYDPKKIFSN